MELKPGYQRTDVGPIPDDWSVKLLHQLGKIRTGPFGTLLKANEYAEGDGVPLISVGEIGHGKFRVSEETPRISSQVVKRLPQFVLRRGDIVFGRKGAVNRSSLVSANEDGWFLGSDGISVRPTGECHPSYLAAQLQSSVIQAWLIQNSIGTTMPSLNQAILGLVRIPCASSHEQRAIATVLSDFDALIAGLERLIAKKRDIKQAAMQQLLTGQTRLPGFSGEWEMLRLGDLAVMGSGGTPASANPRYYDGDVPWVAISDMTRGGKLIERTERNLTADGLANCAAQMFPAGTVLYAMYASLGECSIAGIPLCSSQAILGIRPNSRLSAEFLYYVLVARKSIVKAFGQQGTQANLNKGIVQGFEILLPQEKEQTAIAAVMSDMDADLSALESRLAKTSALKQGMMQELLTGRTRLV
ncbi:restriction endonuclease subunit S [Paraburkholderia dilworthii]|uniref:Restriction endonuclease subunit S n=1 Tax=Paraburkholderia dilworthii TaxID=948106 RepID=A0ABW9DF63_9BURK